MPLELGARVFIYWNLHRECWSVRCRGRVIAHVTRLTLERVQFRVSEAGRQRVLRERRKNVHAGVYGKVVGIEPPEAPQGLKGTLVSYNPYRGPDFYDRATGEPVTAAPLAYFGRDRQVIV